jgi:L-2-hydroxyglutarate oxidase
MSVAPPEECDLAVVGGGILGLAVARDLIARPPERSIVVLERNSGVGMEQTSRNSGVVHAGIYYASGSLKARLCVAGARELYAYCDAHAIRYDRCGKLIVARDSSELARLDELERRGRANGVAGLQRLSADELREVEPHARGVAALHSPDTGIVDFAEVARAFASELDQRGTPVVTGCEITGVVQAAGRIALRHPHGETRARFAVFCAGLASDRLAVAAGASPDPRVVPFRGAYRYLRPERRDLVQGLIYPVPDPALPFLGVHLTRHIGGEVSVGPSALLWPRGPRDLLWPGTPRMARRWWRTGVRELYRAVSRRAFAAEAARYVPELAASDLADGFSGIRAQALARDGTLVDDFVLSETERALHVRNAPSPAATSSLALARMIGDRVCSVAPA